MDISLDASAPRWRGLWAFLPRGRALPEDVWSRRHRGILILLWLHVPFVFTVALVQGIRVAHAVAEVSVLAALAGLASACRANPRLATVITSVGLLTSSAELVHVSDGLIEMHFHFFVMVGVVTLYQDWRPFLAAIGYVVLQHGVAGALWPTAVYNHPEAARDPWTWAGVHGAFILAMSVAGMVTWRLNENLLDSARGQELALRRSESELRDALSLLSATLESTADGILVVDLEGRITSFNASFVEMWALPLSIIEARDDATALAFVLAQLVDPAEFTSKVAELYASPQAESYDTVLFNDGRIIERYSKPQRVGGEIVGRVWSFRDVTVHRRLEDELAHQAFHDSLTGLANQALFRDRVDHALARIDRSGMHLAVVYLDLDNFKTVNDSLGHTAGDELLVAATARIRSALREADTAARLGGDEFAVLLEDTTGIADAVDVANRLLELLRRPFALAGKEVVVGASIGITLESPGTSSDQLLRNADLAMYTAKRMGKGRFEVFQPEMHTLAVERLEVEADLRRACERGELILHYQPIVTLQGEAIVGTEALVRWVHPRRGLLLPSAFIEIAEDCGLIDEIGGWVLETACMQARQWEADASVPAGLSLSVNLSPRQLRDPQLVDHVATALEQSGLHAENLTLEITEGAMMHDTDLALRQLHGLKALGVKLAIDDFGTGYSSLSYLQRFPIDELKIDRSFVSGVDRGPEESALARAIVRLSQTLRLVAVAEGVETAEQCDLLRTLGCELGQGYLFGRPEPAVAITERLRMQRSPNGSGGPVSSPALASPALGRSPAPGLR
jgi:diguanylate cyclase (GGDEF)-like protein